MRKIIAKIISWYKKHSYVSCFLVFLLASAFFLYLQATSFFADPDSFYHAKLALLIRDQGVIKDFHWLGKFTELGKNYIDQHFLYHVALIPFETLMDPLIGIKVATVIFASLLVFIFALILWKFGVKGAWVYGIALIISNPFTFRMSLAKAPSFSIIFLLIGIYFLWAHRYRSLFGWSFLYVWAYGGFALLPTVSALYAVTLFLFRITRDWRKSLYVRISELRLWEETKTIAACFGGTALGIIINPYFPENLLFYKSQLIDIGMINYQNQIGVGGEWYPYAIYDLIPATFMVSIFVILAILFLFIFHKKQTPKSISSFFIFLFFLLLTIKSRRYVEYYVPMAALFSAITIHESLMGLNWNRYFKNFFAFYFKYQILCMILGIYIMVMVPAIVVKDLQVAKNDLKSGIRFDKFTQSMSWLVKNSEDQDLIFHCDWDEFPVLFYRNHKNDYIAGLDPTFMYKYNKERYWEWAKITKGEKADNLYPIIKDNFGAKFVFLEKDHTAMDQNIAATEGFELIYEDTESKIYRVK